MDSYDSEIHLFVNRILNILFLLPILLGRASSYDIVSKLPGITDKIDTSTYAECEYAKA